MTVSAHEQQIGAGARGSRQQGVADFLTSPFENLYLRVNLVPPEMVEQAVGGVRISGSAQDANLLGLV